MKSSLADICLTGRPVVASPTKAQKINKKKQIHFLALSGKLAKSSELFETWCAGETLPTSFDMREAQSHVPWLLKKSSDFFE